MKEYLEEQLLFAIEDIMDEAFNHEVNFKHADPTTGQRCYDVDEISTLMDEVLEGFLQAYYENAMEERK